LLRDIDSGVVVTAEIRPETLAMAAVYRRVDEALERDRPSLATEQVAQRLQEKERVLDELLPRLRTLPEDELLLVTTLAATAAESAG
jgi:hypothetical protein